MTQSIYFPFKKADLILIELHIHLLVVQEGESFNISEKSSSKSPATNLALIFVFPLKNFSVSTHLVVIVI